MNRQPTTSPSPQPRNTPADASPVHDVLLCQKFLPEHGGSIRWMYEVYRRWPQPVDVITHDYYADPPGTPEFPHKPVRPDAGDDVTDANLRMDRRPIFIPDWGLDRPSRWVRYGRMARAVWQRLRDPAHRGKAIRLHAIHAVPEVACLWPWRRWFGQRLQVVCYAHGEEITACTSSRQLRFLMTRAHSLVDLMLANSSYTANILRDYLPDERVAVINPGVQFDEFAPATQAGAAWRENEGIGDRRMILTVGRLDPRKNQQAVIEAVARLRPRYPDLLYIIAGEGRNRPKLEALAAERNVADVVRFVGPVSGQTKIALYGACDLFAMPAIRDGTDVEGFGMVFLEANACGKPVLAGTEGGQPDAVAHERTGLIVDGDDHDAVTAALDRLLGDAALRQRLGDAGRSHAQRFDWPAVVQRTVEVVENKLGPRRAAQPITSAPPCEPDP